MKMFQAPLNRSLNSIAEKTIEVGKELMGKHDAGSRIQLLAFVDELNFALEAYKTCASIFRLTPSRLLLANEKIRLERHVISQGLRPVTLFLPRDRPLKNV